MKKLALGVAMITIAGCSNDLPQTPPPTVVVARFDPGANPPVVPAPNDLAFNPATGTLNVPASGEPANLDFAAYLNTLNGFPADSPGTTTFSGQLDPTTVPATPGPNTGVRVFDVTDAAHPTEVTDAQLAYSDVTTTDANGNAVPDIHAPGLLNIHPAGQWTPGHTYAVALLGGGNGLKGKKGEQVVGSPAWALLRSTHPLVTCPNGDLTSTDCRSTTDLVPAGATSGPAQRLQAQGQVAAQLEGLRLKYAPVLDYLGTQSVNRADVALLWTFRIADNIVTPAFQPDPDKCLAVVPLPNDLAIDPTTGLLAAPTGCANQTASESEFNADYLNHLNGFPTAAEGTVRFVGGDLDPATVTLGPDNVLVVDLTAAAANAAGGLDDGGLAVQPAEPKAVHYDAATHLLTFDPPTGGWPKGHQFAAAILPGVKGTKGEKLVAGDVFALVRSPDPLVDCDLTDPSTDPTTCSSVITLAPLTNEQAVQLEQLRLALSPAFDALGVDRTQVGVLWTFTIFSNPELSFNPTAGIIPFPFNGRVIPGLTDQLELYIPPFPDGGGGHVHLPTAGNPLAAGLNTLDGFSTTAPIVGAFGSLPDGGSPRMLADEGANIDPTTLAGGDDAGNLPGVGVVNLADGSSDNAIEACLNCGKASRWVVDGGAPAEPEQLDIIPTVPLLEQSDYGAFISIGVKDLQGRGVAPATAFALMRMKNPIVDNGQIQIPALAQAVAAGQIDQLSLQVVELLRQQYQAFFDTMETAGYPRGQMALAWDFHTQTTWTSLAQLHGYPAQAKQGGFPSAPQYLADVTSQYQAAAGPLLTNVNKVFAGSYLTPFLLRQANGTYGAFNPASFASPTPQKVPFVVYEPDPTAHTPPAAGYPVVFFGHGITRYRDDAIALASTFTGAGFAVVAFDEPFHGDRSFCVGAGAVVGAPSDAAVCVAPAGGATCDADPTSATYGRCLGAVRAVSCAATGQTPPDLFCQGQGLGNCAPDGLCEGARFLTDADLPNATATTPPRPVISGWNFIDLPSLGTQFFFPTRDHFRQDVVDLGQLELVVADPAFNAFLTAQGGSKVDAANINYVGQSLGGILGTLYTSAAPNLTNSVLNVPGGNPAEILFTSPNLAVLRDPLLQGLVQLGVTPGTPAFDQFVNFAMWVMDPADPRNAANHLDAPPLAPANRNVLVQYIEGDQTVPNPTTQELIISANRDPAAPQVVTTFYQPSEADWPVAEGRHGFLLSGLTSGSQTKAALTIQAQTEAAVFIATGQKQP